MKRTETNREDIAELIKKSSRKSREAYHPIDAVLDTDNNQASADLFRASADRQRGQQVAPSCLIIFHLNFDVVRSENASTNEQDIKTERFLRRIESKEQAKLSL